MLGDIFRAKAFCKEFKLKFHKVTDSGFIASVLSPVYAGMQFGSSDYRMHKVLSNRIYFDMIMYGDGDISFGKNHKNNHPNI